MTDAIPIIAPDLGSHEPSRVSAWLVEVGETVRAGDRIVELLLPGMTIDVAAPVSGRLIQSATALNGLVRAGQTLGAIEQDDDV